MIPHRPFVIVNVATSADGKIDTVARKGAALSSPADKARVDRLRAEVDAVMVGGWTLVHEDPKLTVKSAQLRLERKTRGLAENPAKVGVVSRADLQLNGAFLTAGPARRLIFTTPHTSTEQIERLKAAGVEVFLHNGDRPDLVRVMETLHVMEIKKLLVEGGGTLLAELFRLGLADEVYIYIAPLIFGGTKSPTLADGSGFTLAQAPRLRLASVEKVDDHGGVLIHYSFQPNH
jgi:2,5-diamino-6-(ribosylamino)-4(3H)-pyrimidinone 5'-phosphate reductase